MPAEECLKVKSLVAGSEAKYTVLRKGAKKTLSATLVAPPRSVLAQWIGEHMLAHHIDTKVAAKWYWHAVRAGAATPSLPANTSRARSAAPA